MVAEQFGVRTSMARLRELTATTDDGTDLGGIEAGARALGFETLAAELPYDELAAGDLLPAILHWDRDHFVVVASADDTGANVLDPATGARRLKRGEFEAHRYGPGRSLAGLVIRPPDRAAAEPPLQTAATVPEETAASPAPPQPTAGGVGDGSPPPVAYPSGRSVLLSTGLLALAWLGLGYVFVEAAFQAIDLQFREAWMRQLGSLLLAVAALGLARYLLFRACVGYASARANAEGAAIAAANLGISPLADARSRARAREEAEDLVHDSDTVRNWFAYDLPAVLTTASALLAGILLIAYVDLPLAGTFALGIGLTAGTWAALRRRGAANRAEAAEARALRLEAEREHSDSAGFASLFDAGDWLDHRLARARSRADAAYRRVATEYNAQAQLVSGAAASIVLAVAGVGLYRLGFAELQVGSLTTAIVISSVVAQRMRPSLEALARWTRQRPSRLRLEEVRHAAAASAALASPPATASAVLQVREPHHGTTKIELPARIALIGPDAAARGRLIDQLLGRDSSGDLTLQTAEGDRPLKSIAALGRVAVVRASDPLVEATLAENISLSARPDPHRLEEAARVVGLDANGYAHGLATRLDEVDPPDRSATKVKVLVARAIYADVDALVVDAATERLTAYEEGVLLDDLLTWGEGKTVVYSSSRSLSAYGFDVIAYVAAGEIESIGAHAALMAMRGAYYYEIIARNASPG